MIRLLTSAVLTLPLIGAFSMFALGIVLIYRASNVLNLAHGAMATLPAYLVYSMVKAGMPLYLSGLIGIALGAVLGVAVFTLILRPLRNESQTTQTVGTVAALGVLLAIIARIWGTAPLKAPDFFPAGGIAIGRNTSLHYGDIGLTVIAVIVAVAFSILFRATSLGLVLRGAADNPRAAVLMGINPRFTTQIAWALGGGLAALAGILLAGVTNLHPFTLSRQVLPAFVAALIGGLGSFPGAIVGACIVGLAQGLVSSAGPLANQSGAAQLVLAVIALIVMALRGRGFAGAQELGGATRGRVASKSRARRRIPLWIKAILGIALLAWPFLPINTSIVADANVAAIYVVIAVSLVVLTGWVGQISLGQAAFVGISAFSTGLLVRGLHIDFPLNLPVAAAVSGLVAVALGMVALRVRGLYLAVATLIFGWMADAYLFKSKWLVGTGGSSTIVGHVIGRPGHFPSFDLTDRRNFWLIACAAAALAVAAAANLRDSRVGRAFFAVRGSEVAAASLGINVTMTKLFAFGLSGVMAGIAGNLIMIDQRTATPDQFSFTFSLFFLAIAVVGGLTDLTGVVIAATVFAALSGISYRVPALGTYLDIVSSGLLLTAVMLSPEPARVMVAKLFAPLTRLRSAVMGSLRGLTPNRSVADPQTPPEAGATEPAEAERITTGTDLTGEPATPSVEQQSDVPVLQVDNVSVIFGGLVAAKDVSLHVDSGEIVGLIGPNGAGKTTVFNAISGFAPATQGTVKIFDKDVTALAVHERAKLGLARTFQVLQLFSDATVFDNLLVATHLHSESSPLSSLFLTDRSLKQEREARRRVREVISLTGLKDVADVVAGDLPFGILRKVDVGRAVVTGGALIMLDEPASGLDERETDELQELLVGIRDQMGRTLLLIEHDIRFVTSITSRLYVLERGQIIASGTPAEIRSNELVITAYLGGDVSDLAEPQLLGS